MAKMDYNSSNFKNSTIDKLSTPIKDKPKRGEAGYCPTRGDYSTKCNPSEKMEKMGTLKATSVSANNSPGKLKQSSAKPTSVKEAYSFDKASIGTKDKTKNTAAMTSGGSGLTRANNPSGKLGAARVTNTEKKAKTGYKREKTLFEAKAGTSASGKDFSNMSASEIKSKKQDLKQDRRDYRKSSVEGKNVGIKESTMDIRQARKADRYTRKADSGKLSHFTPNYKDGENKQGTNRIEAFKGSQDNAVNRNTMLSKLNAIAAKPINKTKMS